MLGRIDFERVDVNVHKDSSENETILRMNADIDGKISAKDRRLHPRFPARERALVAVSGDDFGLPYNLIDISEGGMAFLYMGNRPLIMNDIRMDIYMDEDLDVGRLPVTVVADRQLPGGVIPKRRCSVRFGQLTTAQQLQLKAFFRFLSKHAQTS